MVMEKRKILVVDDQQELAEMVKFSLESTDQYEVKIETKGRKALEAAKACRPDLILLDMKMPDLNGFEVMYQLEADPDMKNVPVVFLTGALTKDGPTADPDTDDSMIGRYPYLVKPSSTEDLIACIEKYLRK